MRGFHTKKAFPVLCLIFGLFLGLPGISVAATLEVPTDYATIQGAIDAASSGDTINVKAGNYTEGIQVTKNNLTLRSVDGVGMAHLYRSDPQILLRIQTGLGVAIDGFSMDAGGGEYAIFHYGGATASPITITNNTIENANNGFYGSWNYLNGTTFTFAGNSVRNCSASGLFAYGFQDCTVDISGNTMENCSLTGIRIGDMGEEATPMEMEIQGNTITNSGGISCLTGIYVGDAENKTRISGNTIQGDIIEGISISGMGRLWENSEIFIERNQIAVKNAGIMFGTLFSGYPGSLTVRYNTVEVTALDEGTDCIYISSFMNAGGSSVVFVDNNFLAGDYFENYGFNTSVPRTILIDAKGNWWGDASGPLDEKILPGTPDYNNPGGQGCRVSSGVDYADWRTTAWVEPEPEESSSSGGCSAGILNPLFLLLLAPLGLLLKKSR